MRKKKADGEKCKVTGKCQTVREKKAWLEESRKTGGKRETINSKKGGQKTRSTKRQRGGEKKERQKDVKTWITFGAAVSFQAELHAKLQTLTAGGRKDGEGHVQDIISDKL